jgi:hypothetical protein
VYNPQSMNLEQSRSQNNSALAREREREMMMRDELLQQNMMRHIDVIRITFDVSIDLWGCGCHSGG